MKKLLFSFALATSFAGLSQQQVVTFEEFTLPQADTFYNGADLNYGFSTTSLFGNSVIFSNYYEDGQFGEYWYGFGYSNMTDTQTAGYGNQYSAYNGSGANQSANYGLFYPNGTISFAIPTIVDSVKISNSTYAALSMLNGDSYGKQFGSSTNAQGQNDGTNGEDFLKLWIIGYDDQQQKTDSVLFYLADYQNGSAVIVDTWENVDLSSLGSVSTIDFRFESSDMSFGFINTPTYFVMDDLAISNLLSVDKNSANSFKIYPNPIKEQLNVLGLSGEISIKNLEGKLIYSGLHAGNSTIDVSNFVEGIYFVTLVNENGQFTQKVIK